LELQIAELQRIYPNATGFDIYADDIIVYGNTVEDLRVNIDAANRAQSTLVPGVQAAWSILGRPIHSYEILGAEDAPDPMGDPDGSCRPDKLEQGPRDDDEPSAGSSSVAIENIESGNDDDLYKLHASMAKTHQVPQGTLPALQRNAARTKDVTRRVPRPIVIAVKVNGKEARALLDSGSLGDFMSSSLADQLGLSRMRLQKPITVQLAVQGSKTQVNYASMVSFEYTHIREDRWFDVINVDGYNIILGTPFMFQHQCTLGFNESKVIIGSNESLPIKAGVNVTTLSSRAMDLLEGGLDKARQELKDYAMPLCKKAAETALPPLREVNHRIPVIGTLLAFHHSGPPSIRVQLTREALARR
jgi:hypothetical protein